MTIKSYVQLFLKDPSKHAGIELFRYLLIGGSAFVIDISFLYLLTDNIGIHYLVSTAIAFFLASCFHYLLSVSWVFRTRSVSKKSIEFTVFFGIGVVGLGLTEILMYVFTDLVGFYYLFSKFPATALVFFWNYLARKFLLFRHPASPASRS